MGLSTLPIGYCANVHPALTFRDLLIQLNRYTKEVAGQLGRPMAIGLWLPNSIVAEMQQSPNLLANLRAWLADHRLIVYTLNAFPFGNFHAERVKEQVYLPDWTTRERADYTIACADILQQLLPEGVSGSISTSPLAFKQLEPTGRRLEDYLPELQRVANAFATIEQSHGKTIRLAIEPEPLCRLETTAEAIEFFQVARDHLARNANSTQQARFGRHIGLCYDVCHQAVEFEDIATSIRAIDAQAIPIAKVHVTNALELNQPGDADARSALARFIEPRYLHQTFAEPVGDLAQRASTKPTGPTQLDLDQTLCASPDADWLARARWRIHFHVPIHVQELGPLRTTRGDLQTALQTLATIEQTPHLEVETYTWNVLPTASSAVGAPDLVGGLTAELTFANELVDRLRDKTS